MSDRDGTDPLAFELEADEIERGAATAGLFDCICPVIRCNLSRRLLFWNRDPLYRVGVDVAAVLMVLPHRLRRRQVPKTKGTERMPMLAAS